MPEKHLPFMLGAIASAGAVVPGAKVNVTRIVEALIFAALTAGATTWASTQVLRAEMIHFEKRLTSTEEAEKQNTSILREDIKYIQAALDGHIQRASERNGR